MSQIDWQRSILDAAEERGWIVVRLDLRDGIILEEPMAVGITMRLSGHTLDADFIRSLPEARHDLLTDVGSRLALGGWRWHHVRRLDLGLQMGDPGFPDVIALRGPELLVVELKGLHGRYELGQREWLAAFDEVRRIRTATWRPADIDEIAGVLR
jgi:hypothetical protein